MHFCAVRVFAESILRYGLPPSFLASVNVHLGGNFIYIDYLGSRFLIIEIVFFFFFGITSVMCPGSFGEG